MAKKLGTDVGYHLTIAADDFLRFPQYNNGAKSNAIVPLNQWIHIVAIQDNGVNKLYINGILQNTTGVYSIGTNSEPLVLGKLYSSAGSWFF